MLRLRKAPLHWRSIRYLIGVQAIGILTCGSVSAQVWNEEPNGDWGDADNWLGPVPGDIADPGFIAGALVFFSGPSLQGDEKVQVRLEDKNYSVGSIFIQTDAGVRLIEGILSFNSPSPRLIVLTDGDFETADSLELILEDDLIFALADGLEARIDGAISGEGGITKRFLGALILNSEKNRYEGDTIISEGELRVTGNVPGSMFIDGGLVTIAGGQVEGTTVIENGVLNVVNGSFDNKLSNKGGEISLEGGSYGGGIENARGLLSVGGHLNGGPVDISNAAQLRVDSSFDQGGGTLKNSGIVWLNADVSGIETLFLDGTITTEGPHVAPSLKVGTILGSANARFDLRGNDVVGLDLNVNANLEGNVTVLFPSGELRGIPDSITPKIQWQGSLPQQPDSLALDFGLENTAMVQQGIKIPVLQISTPNISGVTATGLPDSSSIVNAFLQFDEDTRTFSIVTAAHPSLGGIANSVVMVASLLGPIIDRPSASFGVSAASADGCNEESWIQWNAGKNNFNGQSGTTLGDGSPLELPSVTETSYRGFTGGINLLCRRTPSDSNVLLGLNFGLNEGVVRQNLPEFTIDPATLITTVVSSAGGSPSFIEGDFLQFFGGLYLVVQGGRYTGELQLRREETSFKFFSSGPASLPINGQRLRSEGTSVSSRVSYQVLKKNGFTLSSFFGGGATYFAGSNLDVSSPGTAADIGAIRMESYTRKFGFIGASISQEVVSKDERRISSGFARAEYNFDLSPSWPSRFSQAGGHSMELKSDSPGSYGEVEFGVRRLVKTGKKSNSGQVQLSMTGGFKFGDGLRSNDVSVQLQVSF